MQSGSSRIARWMEWIVAVSYYCASFCVTVLAYMWRRGFGLYVFSACFMQLSM